MRVLIVDDDSFVRDVIRMLLHRDMPDALVFDAASVADAKRVLATTSIDIVVTDVAMERRDAGWDVAEYARARGIAVLLLSGRKGAAALGKPLSVPLFRKSELARVSVTDAIECAVASQAGRVERIPA